MRLMVQRQNSEPLALGFPFNHLINCRNRLLRFLGMGFKDLSVSVFLLVSRRDRVFDHDAALYDQLQIGVGVLQNADIFKRVAIIRD